MSALERLPVGVRRGLTALVPMLLLAAFPAGFAIAPTVGYSSAHVSLRVTSLLAPLRGSAASSASGSSTAGILASAREFASAYMSYQAGRKPGWVRTAIKWTCTPAFASNLLRRPPPSVSIETDRVTGVFALGDDTARVTYVSGRSDSGALVLTLSASRGRWLVSHVGA